ncbi:MAG: hypothetical protein GY861_14445, partial [bacterium]|nr:hypothetical protein [bacterium]
MIHSNDEVLRQFLLSHLKPGSPPAIIISSKRKRRVKARQVPKSFAEEMLLLRNTFEEGENAQRALMHTNQIQWNGQAHTLDKLYANIKSVWLTISPEVDLSAVRAWEMLKIILERDVELGAYLQEQVDKRSIQLNDHAILKEAEAWMDQKSIVTFGYKRPYAR